jgi:hypothetical protein
MVAVELLWPLRLRINRAAGRSRDDDEMVG